MTENLAYVAENDVILKGITEQLEKLSDRIDVKYDSHVDSYQLSPSVAGTSKHAEASRFAQLTLKSGETLQAKLLVSIIDILFKMSMVSIDNCFSCTKNIGTLLTDTGWLVNTIKIRIV